MTDETKTLDVICVDDVKLFRPEKESLTQLLGILSRYLLHTSKHRDLYSSPFGMAYGDNFMAYLTRVEDGQLIANRFPFCFLRGNVAVRLGNMYDSLSGLMRREEETTSNPLVVMYEDDYNSLIREGKWNSYSRISSKLEGITLNLIATIRKDRTGKQPTPEPVGAAQDKTPSTYL